MSHDLEDAFAQYESFHKYSPRHVGDFPASFQIPRRIVLVGEAVNVSYRSRKLDPETLKRPKRPVDYIHEHEGGVNCYRVDDGRVDGELIIVPDWIRDVLGLALLGRCLGFAYLISEGGVVEAEGRPPLPYLYAIPSGKCLVVVDHERTGVLAMMWGGKLDVRPEGIVG